MREVLVRLLARSRAASRVAAGQPPDHSTGQPREKMRGKSGANNTSVTPVRLSMSVSQLASLLLSPSQTNTEHTTLSASISAPAFGLNSYTHYRIFT